MKKCPKCHEIKSIKSFYQNKSKHDGLSSQCKECERITHRLSRIKNPETYKRKDRNFYKTHREEKIEKIIEYEKKHPYMKTARGKVRQALKKGILIKHPCFCGNSAEAHHPNYLQPLNVIWLCKKHHREKHGLCKNKLL